MTTWVEVTLWDAGYFPIPDSMTWQEWSFLHFLHPKIKGAAAIRFS